MRQLWKLGNGSIDRGAQPLKEWGIGQVRRSNSQVQRRLRETVPHLLPAAASDRLAQRKVGRTLAPRVARDRHDKNARATDVLAQRLDLAQPRIVSIQTKTTSAGNDNFALTAGDEETAPHDDQWFVFVGLAIRRNGRDSGSCRTTSCPPGSTQPTATG